MEDGKIMGIDETIKQNEKNKNSLKPQVLKTMTYFKTMISFCLNCKRIKNNINPRVSRISTRTITFLSKCAVCNSKISTFTKE